MTGLGRALVALTALTTLAGCSTTTSPTTEEQWMEYLETVRRLEAEGVALVPGSDGERQAIARFQRLLADFKAPDFRSRIRDVYADEVFFNDTLKTIRSADDLEAYLVESAQAVDQATVGFLDLAVTEGNYYFRWTMTLRFKRFARGEEKRSIGMTHVRFDREGRVVLHQDFWDSVGGLFEHVPGIGFILRQAKRRI